MDDNQPKDIVPKKSGGSSKASELAKRGLQIAQSPTSVQHSSSLSQFLDSVGGIPDNNKDMRFREINESLKNYFSKMTMDEISTEMEIEFQKRPNGRTLKLLGFSYIYEGRFDDAIETLTNCLKITSEDPVFVYEDLGRCYILKGDWETAKLRFAESDRYDFNFFLTIFGSVYLYMTAFRRCFTRPPIFGVSTTLSFDKDFLGKATQLFERARQMEEMADVISIHYEKKSLFRFSSESESIKSSISAEYAKNPDKLHNDIKDIQEAASELWDELKTSNWHAKMSNVLRHGLDVLDAIQKSEREQQQVDKLLSEGRNFQQNSKTPQAIKTFEKALTISEELDYQ